MRDNAANLVRKRSVTENYMEPGNYRIIDQGNNEFVLEHKTDASKNKHVKVQIGKNGKVEYVGLPDQFDYFMETFTDQEKLTNALSILQTMINDGVQDKTMMTDEEVKLMIEKNVQFKTTDPRLDYEIVSQIGVGGFS